MTQTVGTSQAESVTRQRTQVAHCVDDSESVDVYVGRGPNQRDFTETPIGKRGWLGNPYHLTDYSRAESIELFKAAFIDAVKNDAELAAAVAELSGQTLGCWCQRLDETEPACHGEVIADVADVLASCGDLDT